MQRVLKIQRKSAPECRACSQARRCMLRVVIAMPLSNAFGPDVYASLKPELRTLAQRGVLRSFPKKPF